jgi:hypothetical protein
MIGGGVEASTFAPFEDMFQMLFCVEERSVSKIVSKTSFESGHGLSRAE